MRRRLPANPLLPQRFSVRRYKGGPLKIPEALARYWDQQLAASGFVDAESYNEEGEPYRQTWGSRVLKAHRLGDRRRIYFQTAAHILETYAFDDDLDRAVWAAHCQGLSLRQITKSLGVSFWTVRKRLKNMKKVLAIWK